MKYFSMFSGIGGFDLALNRQGHTCIGYSEIDKYAIKTYEKNFGKEVKNYGDARKIDARKLPDFNFLCGGFPCQAFSIAGKRKGFGDTRGTLFFEIARILKIKRPKYVLLENVKGLLNHEGGATFRVIIQALEELGYNTQWMVLNSKFFGVPQNRERVFIVGSLRGQPRPEILPFKENATEVQRIHETAVPLIFDSYNKIIKEDQANALKSKINSTNLVARCLTGGGNSGGLHSDMTVLPNGVGGLRRLTPIECERLQGFPDNFTEGVSNTQRYKQLGNAVTVSVPEAIIKKVLKNEN